jgi:hypothetical protein
MYSHEKETVMQGPKNVAPEIFKKFPLNQPRIVFRYDSRPIASVKEAGSYKALDPKNAMITEGGENQNMVGVALNYVGSLNYKGYAKKNADPRTKAQWKEQKYESYYWLAMVVRSGCYTFEWLLNTLITDYGDRNTMRRLVVTRTDASADAELKTIAGKYQGQGVNNIGSTEIATTEIPYDDVLGYFEIRSDQDGPYEYQQLQDIRTFEDIGIPMDDFGRHWLFMRTGGSIGKLSTFM